MSFIIERYDTVLSSNNFSVSTAAVQISGGNGAALASVAANFQPSYNRRAARITNTGTTNIFLGATNAVTKTASYFAVLAPQGYYIDPSNGSADMWAVSDAAGGTLNMDELQ